ncbi:hypothetical protein ALI22I_34060 [Saccharothrix sp. ALI-22-I]|uniref:hypothetical protein n=1 Tax=Saccharothrix sp. ALI-22-I TaxID=1933778 RepID=UPI00097BBD76|nr:hypothetical protein [Saccharothrix sp. ALI-22-I]ONI83519.1 hypothetical protein ALI22I_34060 [Saccharothrix sp. ALI-22-I]
MTDEHLEPYLDVIDNVVDQLLRKAHLFGGEWEEWLALRDWPQGGNNSATVNFEIDALLAADDDGEHWGVRQIRAAEILFDVEQPPPTLAELGYDRATGTLRGRRLA